MVLGDPSPSQQPEPSGDSAFHGESGTAVTGHLTQFFLEPTDQG